LAKRAGWDKSTSGSKALDDDDYRQLLRLLAESALVDTTVSDHTVSVATVVLRGKMPAEGVCCGNLQEPCWLANAMAGVCCNLSLSLHSGSGLEIGASERREGEQGEEGGWELERHSHPLLLGDKLSLAQSLGVFPDGMHMARKAEQYADAGYTPAFTAHTWSSGVDEAVMNTRKCPVDKPLPPPT